ncbi:MAG: hypothetical protein HQL39_01365 [Alphaproteobacteria bacterium]|nr:hypothetical protein [Alphaproteobacteria bacterium]
MMEAVPMNALQTQKASGLWKGYGWYLGSFYSRIVAETLCKQLEAYAMPLQPPALRRIAEDMAAEAWCAAQDALRQRGL